MVDWFALINLFSAAISGGCESWVCLVGVICGRLLEGVDG